MVTTHCSRMCLATPCVLRVCARRCWLPPTAANDTGLAPAESTGPADVLLDDDENDIDKEVAGEILMHVDIIDAATGEERSIDEALPPDAEHESAPPLPPPPEVPFAKDVMHEEPEEPQMASSSSSGLAAAPAEPVWNGPPHLGIFTME